MSDQNYHITELTSELMQQYRSGKLNTAMQHAVEKYLLDHPFEAEAMEGLEMFPTIDLIEDVNDLKTKLQPEEVKVVSLWKQYWKVAAVLLVLVVSTFVLLKYPSVKPEAELALNETPLEKVEESNQEEEALDVANTEEIDEVSESEKNESSEPPLVEEQLALADIEEEDGEAVKEIVVEKKDAAIRESDDVETVEITNEDQLALSSGYAAADSDLAEAIEEAEAVQELELETSRRMAKATPSFAPNSTNRIVKGKVMDSEGAPLPGVNVIVEGTIKGTITDLDGNYELSIDEKSDQLAYSFIGYENEVLDIGQRTVIDVTMSGDNVQLSEVVVTGAGRAKKQVSIIEARPIVGLEEYHHILLDSLSYPQQALDNHIKGVVKVQFEVKKDSSLVDFKVIEGLGYGCDEEAVRLIKEGPKWKPAIKNGKPVRRKTVVEVKFE